MHDGLGWSVLKQGALPPSGAGITFERPLALYADRCHWDDPDGLMGPTEQNRVRVLDVGGERVVVRAISFPTTEAEDLAELIEMLDSIEIRVEG